jgi:hypothetical protein
MNGLVTLLQKVIHPIYSSAKRIEKNTQPPIQMSRFPVIVKEAVAIALRCTEVPHVVSPTKMQRGRILFQQITTITFSL